MSEIEITNANRQIDLFGQPDWWGAQFQYDLYYGLVGNVDFPLGEAPRNPGDTPWYWGIDWQKMPDTLSGKPVPVWAPGVANGLVSHYHVDQMRWVSAIGILDRDSSLDIDLIDDEGVPLVDPSVPPSIVCRTAIATDTGSGFPAQDFISDSTQGTWTDAFVNMPLKDGLVTKNALSWRLRLNRTPVPHWRITVSSNRMELSTTTPDTFRFGARLDILGNYSGPHVDYLRVATGSPWDVGRISVILPYQYVTDVQSLDVVNGSASAWNQVTLARGIENVGASSNATLYPRTPTSLIGDTQVFSTSAWPMVRVLAEADVPNNPTKTTEPTWIASSLGLGANDRTSPPFDQSNIDVYGYYSEVSWDAVNTEWKLKIYNQNTTTQRSFYHWWLGIGV
jgi:hypothetical protein